MNTTLRQDAIAIWKAGVAAVNSSSLVRNVIGCTKAELKVADQSWSAGETGRVCVVGAGKAGAGMAAGLEDALSEEILDRTSGWVNVPEDCLRQLKTIQLHGARPAGVNEPTEAGVEGTLEILRRVSCLGPEDLCIVLISGGGSALLPAPVDGIRLCDKQIVTRELMHAGATIEELNTVRRALSKVKGGGLLRACNAGTMVALIISDVIGDPLEVIASGPTIEIETSPASALKVLESVLTDPRKQIPEAVFKVLESETTKSKQASSLFCKNIVIGNNQTAVNAAAEKAQELGYELTLIEADQSGIAKECGSHFADRCLKVSQSKKRGGRYCLISGGEPTVQLAKTDQQQKGGRNQEFVLAAAKRLKEFHAPDLLVLSGGTDGEDGPTDAAGALIDQQFLDEAAALNLDIDRYLSVNNSYPFFEAIDGLIRTGPTHTNVMDLRIGLVRT